MFFLECFIDIFLKKFILIYIVIFSVYMIYFFIRSKIKKINKILPIEMVYLSRIYGIVINSYNKKIIEKDIALNNSFIITIDMMLLFSFDNILLKFILAFIITFVLIFILYNFLGKKYRKIFR